jgi:hypothetical protein
MNDTTSSNPPAAALERVAEPSPAPRSAVQVSEARTLVNNAMDLERKSAAADVEEERAAKIHRATRAAAGALRNEAARAWAVARLALRACSRGEPMPENAGEIQLQLADADFTIPDNAKPGDIVKDPRTGARYILRADMEGDIYAFPLTQ